MSALRLLNRGQFLKVIRQNDAGHGPFGLSDTQRAVNQVPHLSGDGHHLNVFMGNIFEQGDKIDFLLIAAAERGTRLLTHQRYHGE